MKFSIIVPCRNEEDNIIPFYKRVHAVAERLIQEGVLSDYEFFFVDDGSKDGTLSVLKRLADANSNIFYLSFTRNFGKEAAMLAGLTHCRGDYVTIMDADLQDPPELLPEMFSILNSGQGYECVATRRVDRKGEPPIRSLFARLFYFLINRISDVEIVSGARDFRLMTRRMVDSILTLKEKSRFSKGLFVWAGYRTHYLEYENVERIHGSTGWSFWKLLKYSMDGITAFSVVPLQISAVTGCLFCAGSLLAVLYFVIQKLTVGIPVQGYAMLICSMFLLGGMQLLGIGILGQYLGKVFIESKHRPDYVVLESNLTPADQIHTPAQEVPQKGVCSSYET